MAVDREKSKTEYTYNEIGYEWLVRNYLSTLIADYSTSEETWEDGDIDRTAETIAQRVYNFDGEIDIFKNFTTIYYGSYFQPCTSLQTITLSEEAKDAFFPRLDGKEEELAVKVISKLFKRNNLDVDTFFRLRPYRIGYATRVGRILTTIVEDCKIDPVHDSLRLSLWPLVLERAWKKYPDYSVRDPSLGNAIRVYCLLRNSPSLYMNIGK